MGQPKTEGDLILPMQEQVNAWRKASRKMDWAINDNEFNMLEIKPLLSEEDRIQGFMGAVLFYGFGDDDSGNFECGSFRTAGLELRLQAQRTQNLAVRVCGFQ